MTFLNSILVFGSLSLVIPLVIHLLFRNRFRVVGWGAMQLLERAAVSNQRRIRSSQLLLLLLRCAIPVLLALCLARPVLTGFRSSIGDSPQSLVIVIDDSRSMSARDTTGVTQIEYAKQILTEILRGLSRRDEVILLRSGGDGSPAILTGATDAIRRIEQVAAQSGPIDLARMVRDSLEVSKDASNQFCRILIVSDFRSVDLDDATLQSLARLPARDSDGTRSITFLNVADGRQLLDNVSVQSIVADVPAVVAKQEVTYLAHLRNDSTAPLHDVRVTWYVDGVAAKSANISLEPFSPARVELSLRIDDPGVHVISLMVEHFDALSADNMRRLGVNVIDEVDVVVVDGQPGGQPLEGETDFLAAALSPFASSRSPQTAPLGRAGQDLSESLDALRSIVVREEEVADILSESMPDVVILANVRRPSDRSKNAIAQFVVSGGALVLFDGDAIDPEAYNQSWGRTKQTIHMPAILGALVGSRRTIDAPTIPIGVVNPHYAPWGELAEDGSTLLDGIAVHGYRKLEVRTDDADPTTVLLAMAGGDPLVVSANRGRGRVVHFAVPCDADWTSLPLHTAYVPMMQQLILDLASSNRRATVAVGEQFSVATTELVTAGDTNRISASGRGVTYTIETPGGPEVVVNPREYDFESRLTLTARKPGIYRIRAIQGSAAEVNSSGASLRAAEVASAESALLAADDSRLSAAASSIGAEIHTDVATIKSAEQIRRKGREIWRWVWGLLVIGMVGELILQQRSVRDAGEDAG